MGFFISYFCRMAITQTSSYSRFRAFNEAVVSNLIPNAFYRCSTWDIITAEIQNRTEDVFIFTFQPFSFSRDKVSDSTDVGEILMSFGMLDQTDSGSEEENNIVESMEVVVEQYLKECSILANDFAIDYTGIRKEPFYKGLSLQLSGLYLRFNAQVNTCTPNTWSSLSDFSGEINRRINPIDWNNYSVS